MRSVRIVVLIAIAVVATSGSGQEVVVIPLDNIGIANSAVLNPRRPYPAKLQTSLLFDNRTVDREFDVAFDVHAESDYVASARLDAEAVSDWRKRLKKERETHIEQHATAMQSAAGGSELKVAADDCTLDLDEGEVRCKAQLRVGRFRKITLPAAFLGQHVHQSLKFTVDFRNDIDEPANSTGYLQFGEVENGDANEREEKLLLTPSGSVRANFDPVFPLKEKDGEQVPVISEEQPYTGERHQHIAGEALLQLDYVLATWADVEATFGFKDGDLGDSEAGTDVTATKYKFKLYNSNGTTFHFGKFDFASPANRIAVNESGEGLVLDFGAMKNMIGNPTLGHIVKRENPIPLDGEDRDAHTTILQWNNVPTPRAIRVLRALNTLLVIGEDESSEDPHNYRTYGVELVGGTTLRKRSIAGSVAHYRSSRSGAEDKRGKGDVTLLSLTLNLLREDEDATLASHSVQLLLGRGSADNPATPRVESYVGETQAFAPDAIFLSTLADPLVEGGQVLVGNGLGNKLYAGLQYTTDRFSPLRFLVKALDMGDTIESASTTVSLHGYRFRGDASGPRNAGWEGDIEFGLEASKGIKTSLGIAYFFAGDALAAALPRDVWAVTLGISVEP